MPQPAAPAVSETDDQPAESGIEKFADDAVTGDETTEPAAEGTEGNDDAATEDADDDVGGEGSVEDLGITPEERAAIDADPRLKKLAKSLHKGFTQGRQRDAAAVRLFQAFQSDPAGTVRALAQRAGVKVSEAAPITRDDSDAILTELTDAVGPDLAGKLLPTLKKIADGVAKSVVEPLRRDLDVQLAQGVEEQANLVKTEFIKQHPDYSKHEEKMLNLAKTVRPAPGADALEYMNTLYWLATRGNGDGDAVTRTRDRMVQAATAGGERPGGTPGNRVAPARPDMSKLPKRDKLRAAMDAAIRGERWE